MKVIKVLGWVVVALILFVALSVYLTATNLDKIVKQVVEEVGTETLKTPVTLDVVDIQLMEGKAQLSGLKIKNLPGYEAENLFSMDTILVDINLEAMVNQLVQLRQITIEGIQVAAEQKGATTNIQALMKNLPAGDSSETSGGTGSEPGEGSDLLFKIDNFRFANSKATVTTERWGTRSLDIPAISLQQIGGQQGVPPDQLANAILKPLIRKINAALEKEIGNIARDKAKEKIREELGEDGAAVESTLKSLLSK